MEGLFVCASVFQKEITANLSTSCFPNLGTRALLSKPSPELDLGAPHVSKNTPGGEDKEASLGGGTRESW